MFEVGDAAFEFRLRLADAERFRVGPYQRSQPGGPERDNADPAESPYCIRLAMATFVSDISRQWAEPHDDTNHACDEHADDDESKDIENHEVHHFTCLVY